MVLADDFDDGASAYKQGRYETAASIFEKLAEKGDYRAMSILGSMYAGGQGISQNTEKAFMWLKQAAQHDQPGAQYRLGLMYDHALGVKGNQKKAIRWYQKAARHRYGPAQAMLGLKYARGEGFQADKIKAYAWLSLAVPRFNASTPAPSDTENAVPSGDRQAVLEVFRQLDAELSAAEKQAAAGLARDFGQGK